MKEFFMGNEKRIVSLLGIALICVFIFIGCDMSVVEEGAKAPEITTQPESQVIYLIENNLLTLTVEATAPGGGTLSYRWYSNTTSSATGGTAKDGATGKTYTETLTGGGTFYYYVVVTNSKGGTSASSTSAVATITVNAPDTAEYPVITPLKFGGTFPLDPDKVEGILSITATVNDGGALSYQWYSNTTASTIGGTDISGATQDEYPFTFTTTGTYYYYIIVTNYNDAPGMVNPTSTTTSGLMTVTVTGTYNATFTVDIGTKYQYVRGFGGMDTAWTNVKALEIQDYEKMYHPGNPNDPGNTDGVNGLGYNVMRIMIPWWHTDIEISMLELTEIGREGAAPDRPDQYEGVKIVNKYGGYVLASPWTPPAEWKESGKHEGGSSLLPRFYINFADYLNDYSRHMEKMGAPIYAISMQNEPSWSATTYDGCDYTPLQHRQFWQQVRHFTRDGAGGTQASPTWTGAKPLPKGYGGGREWPYVLTMSGEAHNQPAWLNSVLMGTVGEEVEAYLDILGRHIYGSGVDASSPPAEEFGIGTAYAARWGTDLRARREAAGRETWMTEHNINSVDATSYPNDSTWNYVWKFMNEVDLVIRMNSENAFVWWTSKRFYSMIGDGDHTTIHHAVLGRGFGLSHYAKFSKEMTRVGLSASGTMAGGAAFSESNFNHTSVATDGNGDAIVSESVTARATAFADFAADGTVKAISLVMFTPTESSGSGGYDLGSIKIQLPYGFTVGRAIAMRSTADNIGKTVTEPVAVRQDGNAAYVSLPRSNILSVKFFKAE
jgi:O-glycosyl hydrolase